MPSGPRRAADTAATVPPVDAAQRFIEKAARPAGIERGALLRCLNVLADHGLSLTKLESRPLRNTPWEYQFYVDVEGNLADPQTEAAIAGYRDGSLRVNIDT